MTQQAATSSATAAGGDTLDGIWHVLDEQVAAGRIPGYAAAVRAGGTAHVHTGGRLSLEASSAPMRDDTLFRIASLSKPMAAAMTLRLVSDGVVALDDPVERWLPELAAPRVLAGPDAELTDTVPAARPVTVWHLLTLTSGWGVVMAPTPLQRAMFELGVFPDAMPLEMTNDEFVARIATLPLAFQPGEGWAYETGIDLLGILLSRATGTSQSDLVAEHVTGPMGMTSTAFWTSDVDRLSTAYAPTEQGLTVLDPPAGRFAGPRSYERLGGGLVSTVTDVLRFYSAMADGGAPLLTADEVTAMTTPVLTVQQREQGVPILSLGTSWGLGTSVDVERVEPWMSPGRWGWSGGTGTVAYVDPVRDTVVVLLTQRGMGGPDDGNDAFWQAVADAT